MSAFKQKLAKSGLSLALFASVVTAMFAVSGATATSAFACAGSNTKGQGSSLQATAQGIWTTAFNTGCTPKLEYKSSSSGIGMTAWKYEGTGTFEREWKYIGTDAAPSTAQINNMIAGAGVGSKLQVVPVAQAAVAIIAHPPTGCKVTKISQSDLERAFEGTITNWNQLANKTEEPAGSCNSAMKRVVRSDESGTTYQLKHYLGEIKGELSKTDCTEKTWAQLQPGAANLTWPENKKEGEKEVACSEKVGLLSPLIKPAGTGGGAETETVNSTAGAFGYVDLATAKGHVGTQILEVQNGATTFAKPEAATGEEANCGATYTVPAAGRVTGSGESVNWSEVYGSSLTTAKYPICTLTWDLGWRKYSTAGYGTASGFGTTVNSYLTGTVLGTTGQNELKTHWYAPLPSTGVAASDVLAAAKFAAGKIED